MILGFPNVRNDFGTLNSRPPGYQVVLESPDGESAYTNFFIFSSGRGWQGPFATGLTGPVSTYSTQLGETVFYYVWIDADSKYNINMYSLLTGELISSYNTGYTSINNYSEYGDRSYMELNDGDGNWQYVLSTKSGVKLITVPQTSVSLSFNDSYWAND